MTEEPASDVTLRRRSRAAAQEIFDVIAEEHLDRPEVTRGVMFGSNGLRWGGKLLAFLGGDGELIVKLPAEHAADLVAAGQATAVRVGRNPAREWVAVPAPDAIEHADTWRDLVTAARRYAAARQGLPGRS
jgi:hypothetical protein